MFIAATVTIAYTVHPVSIRCTHERKLSGLLTLDACLEGAWLPLLPSSGAPARPGMSGEGVFRSFPEMDPFVGLRGEGLLGTISPALVLVLFRLGDLGLVSACNANSP